MSRFSVDKKQFEAIYLKFYPILMVYGKTFTTDEPLIEDTIQELFLSLWKKKNTLFIKTSLDAYLIRAFRNNLIRSLKAKSGSNFKIEPVAEEPSEILLAKEEQLKALLNQLPPRQKEVLFLRYYQNKSYQEISDILGISYQVARNFSYRAIQFLKKNMKHLYSFLISLVF